MVPFLTLVDTVSRGMGILWSWIGPVTAYAEGIDLLECIGETCTIETSGNGGLGVFTSYFNLLYPWAVGLCAAFAVLMGLFGGIQMMTAGSNDTARQDGMKRLMMSIGGLLLLLFSSTILNLLNPTFFV